ncbi:MAG: DUF4231 domain-containing protein [Clostridia bacterium]|nr:DUF4231 domain-containing protein [Clostridia bacterium]
MHCDKKIPVIVGVTGHRNIVEEDKPAIKAQVMESLKEIQNLCRGKKKGEEDTPVIMLNAFAQGADMLCAEAAFELGIDVYAVLPCERDKYINSFDNMADRGKLDGYLAKTKRWFVSPDIEKNKAWIKKISNISDDSYEYRQLGIYIAEHSHILIALWDGKPPKAEYGCGTVEVIDFAVEHKFLDKDKLFKPGMINDSAVVWIKSRRQGDGTDADICRKWLISNLAGDKGEAYGKYVILDNPPASLQNIIFKTVAYNAEKSDFPQESVKLWKNADELDDYRKNLRSHYIKANELSYDKNQKKYNLFILLLAIIGTVVACTFLIYDDASLPYMIFPCTVAIALIIWLIVYGKKKAYHKKYVEYRALAEALRIQFYMSMCLTEKPVVANVCDLYAWSQKVDMIWIDKAIQALGVISESERMKINTTQVIDAWIGNNKNPTGQLRYHNDKKATNKQKAKTFENLSKVFQVATVCIYIAIFAVEVVACVLKICKIDWFWEGTFFGKISYRNFAAIILGTVTAGSLLASSFWGKLSYGRKYDDNEKMSKFYASAFERWNAVKNHNSEIERFVKEIAREEIVENGIWCSYVGENGLEINI